MTYSDTCVSVPLVKFLWGSKIRTKGGRGQQYRRVVLSCTFFVLYFRGVKILLGTADTIFLQNYSVNRRKAF